MTLNKRTPPWSVKGTLVHHNVPRSRHTAAAAATEQARRVALAADVMARLRSFKQHGHSLETWVKQGGSDKVVQSNES